MRKSVVLSLMLVLVLLITPVLSTASFHITNERASLRLPSPITMDELVIQLSEYLSQAPLPSSIKRGLQSSIHRGVAYLSTHGDGLQSGPQGVFALRKTRFVLFNLYPDDVTIETTYPRRTRNLSTNASSGNVTQILEIFLKIIPISDHIQTEKRIILRKLYQETSILGPAIGARILENNETSFIIAFGFGIQRYWRFL